MAVVLLVSTGFPSAASSLSTDSSERKFVQLMKMPSASAQSPLVDHTRFPYPRRNTPSSSQPYEAQGAAGRSEVFAHQRAAPCGIALETRGGFPPHRPCGPPWHSYSITVFVKPIFFFQSVMGCPPVRGVEICAHMAVVSNRSRVSTGFPSAASSLSTDSSERKFVQLMKMPSASAHDPPRDAFAF